MLFHTAIILTAKGSNAFADFPPETAGSPLFRNPKDRVSRSFFTVTNQIFIFVNPLFSSKKMGLFAFQCRNRFFHPEAVC